MRINFKNLALLFLVSMASLPSLCSAGDSSTAPAPNTQAAPLPGKKFKRALIVSGGSVSPAYSIGVLAGVEKMGWKPDVIIVVCGTSVGATIVNSFGDTASSLEYAKSSHFMDVMSEVTVETPNVLQIKSKFDAAANGSAIPQLFNNTILHIPEQMTGFLQNTQFNQSADRPRVIMVASKALFSPQDVGKKLDGSPLFSEVFFTDPDTGAALQGLKSPVRKMFPNSRVAENTEVITNVTADQASRASVSDPYLLNPGHIGNDYFFTGAVDLYPIEVAESIADEVVATYPANLFSDYENLAIRSTFGWNQNDRAIQAIQHTDVKWIDASGIAKIQWAPKQSIWSFFLKLESTIPTNLEDFQKGIQAQYDFGFSRAQEALTVQKDHVNVRSHLRKPISPALINGFTCDNAFEWSTEDSISCTSDDQDGCNRDEENLCTVIR